MKRLVWLLLAAFCTLVAQVQPADVPEVKKQLCGCCEDEADACGMPDCGLPPVAPSSGLVLQRATASLRAESERESPAPRARRSHFYVQFLPRPAVPAEIAPRMAAPPASVPAYQAHCSFLI